MNTNNFAGESGPRREKEFMPTYRITRRRVVVVSEHLEIEADTLEAAKAVAMAHIPVNGDVEVLEDAIEYQPEAADDDF